MFLPWKGNVLTTRRKRQNLRRIVGIEPTPSETTTRHSNPWVIPAFLNFSRKTGFEPATFRSTTWHSILLSYFPLLEQKDSNLCMSISKTDALPLGYAPKLNLWLYIMSALGFEPKTCGLKVQCSTTELYTRISFKI